MLRALGRIKTEEGSFFSIFSWTEADFGDPVVETAVATFGAKFTNGLARQLTRWHKKNESGPAGHGNTIFKT